MLGRRVDDPTGIESDLESAAGLGLIPSTTTLTREKQTRAVRATTAGGVTFGGYEIHVGVTAADAALSPEPFATLEDGTADGFCGDRVIGTYLHGALESAEVCAEVFGVQMPPLADKAVTTSNSRSGSSGTGAICTDWGSTDHDRDRDTSVGSACVPNRSSNCAGPAGISSRSSRGFIT